MVGKALKIKSGDTVRVLLGKDRGKKAKVMGVLPKKGRVIVEGVNVVKKHVKAKRAGEKGQRVEVAAPFDVSNVQLVCPDCGKGTRVGINRTEAGKERFCKKCNATIS